ncbi:GapA-binding peptide SR1P [Radiobacillus deserti]|uniref:GapA-binding peptide SR1P n=2 Tax=Radiobacillus deserti TaxID=2594883 RepID=A0A516KL61_9BACI|nr:GapA-binding peptide SR1P [Radiobacillus deserti]
MGLIVCKHCDCEMDTFHSDKVMTYYSKCSDDCTPAEERNGDIEFR